MISSHQSKWGDQRRWRMTSSHQSKWGGARGIASSRVSANLKAATLVAACQRTKESYDQESRTSKVHNNSQIAEQSSRELGLAGRRAGALRAPSRGCAHARTLRAQIAQWRPASGWCLLESGGLVHTSLGRASLARDDYVTISQYKRLHLLSNGHGVTWGKLPFSCSSLRRLTFYPGRRRRNS